VVDDPGAGHVIATDLNPAMVGFGAREVPAATWRQADAMELPFDDAAFDLVCCQFGAMFFPDKPAAFAEARRVLTPDGTLVMAIWGDVASHAFASALVAGVEAAFPDGAPPFVAAVPHGYFDVNAIRSDLGAGGFGTIEIDTVTLTGHASSAADLALGFCTGTPLRGFIAERGDLEATTGVIAEVMEGLLGAGPVAGDMEAHIVTARG
jgi:SAM-dependent methyltransferase